MGKIYNATKHYSNSWSKAERAISEAFSGNKRIPFFIEGLSGDIEEELEKVAIKDVLEELLPLWKKEEAIRVKNWTPDKGQGYHGLSLEKALRVRYSAEFMKDSLGAYQKAAKSTLQVADHIDQYQELVKFE